MDQYTWENIPDQFTADGVKIVPGLRVWDYDYSRELPDSAKNEVIAPEPWGNPAEDVWFTTKNGKTFDGSRLSVRRPW